MFFQALTVAVVLVLPSLIRMENKAVKTVEPCKRFIQHIVYLFQIWIPGDIVWYYLAVEHIQYRRKIKFDGTDIYLCYICRPFAVWGFCRKISVYYVWGNLANLTFV